MIQCEAIPKLKSSEFIKKNNILAIMGTRVYDKEIIVPDIETVKQYFIRLRSDIE